MNAYTLGTKYTHTTRRERASLLAGIGIDLARGGVVAQTAVADFERGQRDALTGGRAKRVAAVLASLGDGPWWIVRAEHTGGGSVAHPCRTGAVSDPAEAIDGRVIAAATEQDAVRIATGLLEEVVAASAPCLCERRSAAGSSSWWGSVVVSVEAASREEICSSVV